MNFPRDETWGLGLIAAGIVALLLFLPGLLGGPGPSPLRVLFGWGAPVFVAALILGGTALFLAGKYRWRIRWPSIIAIECLFFALLALLHLSFEDRLALALEGGGGGLAGWALSRGMLLLAGSTGAWIIAALAVLGCLVSLWFTLPAPWTDAVLDIAAVVAAQVALLVRNMGPSPESEPDAAPPVPLVSPRRTASRNEAGVTPRASAVREAPQPAAVPPKAASRPGPPRTAKGAERGARRKTRPDYLPPLDVLKPEDESRGGSTDVHERAQILKQTLAEFGVPVEVVSIKEGPTVTQFGLEPGETVRELHNGEVLRRRVSVATIMRLSNDLALALAAASLRIEAPVPGRPYVGVEVPNTAKSLVTLRGVIEAREFGRIPSPLAIGLGRDVSGDAVVADLTRMPHLLIAGATGSGKSVCINSIVCSLLMNNGPETVRFLMVDPKMVELPGYNGIPHLLASVVTDPAQATGALAWLSLQMDDRYRLFSGRGVRNIEEYNRAVSGGKRGKARTKDMLPYIVIVIDELADLMMTAADDVERHICRLAQMARATGIHLVMATQRPSVDVITGLIKANFPARIAFAVTSQTDSRVVLDAPGAEKLLGRGDMLFMAPESAKLIRIQGCAVSDAEIDRLVAFWRENQPAGEDGAGAPSPVPPWIGLLDQMEERDDLLEKALKMLRTKKTVSTSLLQRQLRIGFPRAARLMEQLEEMGAVGPDEGGGRSREVLLQPDGPDEP